MTQDRIIELAREAGMEWQGGFSRVVECATQPELERFAALVRAQTLEEAAGVCEEVCDDPHVVLHVGTVCAGAIRQLKDKT